MRNNENNGLLGQVSSSSSNGSQGNGQASNGHTNGKSNGSTPKIPVSKQGNGVSSPTVVVNGSSIDNDDQSISSIPVKSSRIRPNPFKLITCEKYSNETSPFRVVISVEVIAIVDIHAHCVQTEVIGLLGGRYCPVVRQLHVLTAEPCRSIPGSTTDLQCEMDPVSQAEASDKIISSGMNILGWYHSHPTFVPNPSLRDLETQSNFQDMFTNTPFIALILSPYSGSCNPQQKHTLISKFKCLMVSDNQVSSSSSSTGEFRVPYEFSPIIVRREKLVTSILSKTQELMEYLEGRKSSHCMTDKARGRDITLVSKVSTLY